MHELKQWVNQYLCSCKYQKGLDPKTLKAYRIDLQQFSAFMARESMELRRDLSRVFFLCLYLL